MTNHNDGSKKPKVEELHDEPLTIEKHLTDDLKGGLLLPDPAPDRGPYQNQQPKGTL